MLAPTYVIIKLAGAYTVAWYAAHCAGHRKNTCPVSAKNMDTVLTLFGWVDGLAECGKRLNKLLTPTDCAINDRNGTDTILYFCCFPSSTSQSHGTETANGVLNKL